MSPNFKLFLPLLVLGLGVPLLATLRMPSPVAEENALPFKRDQKVSSGKHIVDAATTNCGRENQGIEETDKDVSSSTDVDPTTSSSNIMTINYHKSGNEFTRDLMKIMERSIPYPYKNTFKINYDYNNNINSSPKRTHTQETKCPLPLNLTELKEGNRYFLSISPDLFCSADDLARYLRGVGKVVHMVREPVDMAVSNFLYHSQFPAPKNEHWVHTIRDPCSYERDMIEFALPRAGIDRAEETDPIVKMCKAFFTGNETHPGYPSQTYYQRLRSLPAYDAIRLSTAQFLLSNYSRFAGGDILRMSSNVMSLKEWECRDDHRRVRTICMQDLKEDINGTTFELVDFILRGVIPNVVLRQSLSHQISEEMMKSLEEKVAQGSSHVTGQLLSVSERQEVKDRLERDEIFGPVLVKVRSMMSPG